MTIGNVIQGIVNALFTKFGSGYKIYLEQVNQSLTEPCFFVKCLDPAQNRTLGRMYMKTHQFSVQFFPLVQGSYNECQTILDGLFDCLTDISAPVTVDQTTTNYLLHGSNLQGQMTDGILTFTVTYGLFLLKDATPEVDMEVLTVDVGSD